MLNVNWSASQLIQYMSKEIEVHPAPRWPPLAPSCWVTVLLSKRFSFYAAVRKRAQAWLDERGK